MFRRSRFSVRPNVGTAGRTAPASQEAAAGNQDASEALKDVAEASAAADGNSDAAPSEKVSVSGDVVDQNGESTSSSAAVQRRKRFSIKPKVAPGRPSTLPRTPKSPIKAIAETLVEGSDRGPTTSSRDETPAAPHGLQSPRRRRPSEDNKQHKVLPKTTPVSSSISGPSADDSLNQTRQSEDSVKKSDSQMKVPPRPPEKVPPSLPDKEATEISEKAKTLLSSKSGTSPPPPTFSLSRLLNDPSDLQRLEKARKLRELLKQEMHKEKKLKKKKARLTEYTLDPAKMTMRDLIRYLPMSNPMSTSIEDTAQENETVIPSSPGREESPEKAQQPEVRPKMASPREEGAETAASAAAGEEEEEEEQEEALMVPQVKVAEDGSLIIDEESLTVEVQRAKGPNPIQDRDPIFERGSTTTYSSFRKGIHSKPWSSEETDMFFLAISMVGTDFSMICQLFPHRARAEIKNKFKKEERENTWRIDKAFRERRKLDIEYFSKLLEKILEVQKNRKKLKSISDKMAPKKSKRKTKGKKAARKLSDVEEEDEEEENKLPDLEEEEEGEKENEQLCNEGGAPGSKSKRKRKRQSKEDASTKESNQKKNKTGEGSNEQDEACIPEDVEAALPEDSTNPDKSENAEITAKSTQVKPAKLSRGGAPKPLLPLGRKWSKKPQPTTAKAKESVSDEGEENVSDGASTDQVDKEAPQEKKSANDSVSSEEEDYAAPPSRPTRYGRVPKPTKLLNYPAKDDASESTQAAPARSAAQPKPKCSRKRGSSSQASTQDSKKSKLVTLRASQSECSDEDDEGQREDEELVEEWPACSSGNSPVFVPASLRPPQTEISEVEETMEELDILANMPDVLGISQDALCPDASCEQAQNETGTADPCEHQLDLLVDVIDFLSSEHAEVSEVESYNEAAQTLLTIGNLTHLSQSAQSQTAAEDHETGTSVSVSDISRHPEEDIAAEPLGQEECDATPAVSTEAVKTVSSVEPQNNAANNESWSQIDATPIVKTGDQKCSEQRTVSDQTPQLPSNLEISKTDSPQVTRGRSSKVKPKPNVDRASRTAPSKSQTDASTVRTPVESKTASPDVSQGLEKLSSLEEATSKIAGGCPALVEGTISSEKQSYSEAQFESIMGQTTMDTSSADEILISHAEEVEIISNNLATSGMSATESQVQQESISDSVAGQESSHHAAASEEPPVSQTRKSRFQKVKPILPQRSRSVRSKAPTTGDPTERDSSQSSNFESETIAEAESQPIHTTPSVSPNSRSASDLTPPVNLGSTHTATEETSSTEESETPVGLGGQVDSAKLDPGSPETRHGSSEVQVNPILEQPTSKGESTSQTIHEKLTSPVERKENSNLLRSGTVTESQVGLEANENPSPVTESTVSPTTSAVLEELPVSQKEENEVLSTNRTRKSRFQKAKPNLQQRSRTVGSKLPTTKDPGEKGGRPSSDLESKTKGDVELQQTPSSISQSTGSGSALISTMDLGSTCIPTEEPSSTEVMHIGLLDHVDSAAATLDLVAPENKSHCFPEAQIDPRLEQATADKGATSESTGDKPLPHVGNTDRSNVVTVDTITDLQVGGGENVNESPSQDSGNNPVASVEELPNIQPEAMEEAVTCPNRCQLETSKPSLPPTPRSVQPKPPTASDCSATLKPESTDSTVAEAELSSTFNTNPCIESHSIGSASVLMPTLEFTHKPEEELPSAEVTQTNTGLHKVSSLEDSKQNATQRRRRIAKAKPNLGLAPRTVQSKVQPKDISKLSPQMSSASNAASEQQPVDRAQTEPDITNSKQMKSPLLEQSGNRINEEGGSSDSNVIVTTLVAENRSVSTAPKIKSNEKPAVEEETKMDSTSDHGKVEVRPVADSEFDMSFRAIESHTQQILDSHLVPNVQASEGSLAESKNTTLRPDNGQSTPQPSESVQQSSTENTPAIKSQDVVKLSSETREINQSMDTSQAPQCRDDNTSGASCKPSRKGPQTRRGRLVKPKPNLGRGSRAPQPQQTESATQADAATGSCLDASGSHRPVSGVQPDIQEPVEGAIEQVINRASPQNDAGSSLGFVTQVPEVSNQEATLASIGGTQGYSSFTIFPEMLTVPSDPDEPFFILSLTEIPVSSSGEVMDNPSEPLPDLPAPVQLQSVPGESVAAAEEDGSLPTVFVPVSTEETGGSGLVPETGPVGYISSFRENPVDPCEGTGVDPLQTVGDSEESNIPATKTRQTGRRAKLQVKPSASRKKQASKVLAYEEAESVPVQANTHQIPELPRPPRQREPDDAHEGNKALKNLEDNSLAPQTRTSTPDRKPHSFSSFLSETNIPAGSKNPPCAASKVSTQKTARPQTPPSPAASVSHTVAPSSPPETPGEARSFTPSKRQAETEQTAEPSDSDSTPSASLTVTEVSVSQQSDCVEVEPISVSQYFLSDIFTEVEEG